MIIVCYPFQLLTRKLSQFEQINLIHLNDVNESVQKASNTKSQKHRKFFKLVYRRLAIQHQNVVDKIQQEMSPKIDKFIELNFKIQEQTDPVIDQFIPFEFIAKTNLTVHDFPQDLKTQLYFGFLPKEILQDTLNQKDLSMREKDKEIIFLKLNIFLEYKIDNWNQKEELINLISYLVLMIHPSEQWFYGVNIKEMNIIQEKKQVEEQSFNLREVDFQRSLIAIDSYLNDPIQSQVCSSRMSQFIILSIQKAFRVFTCSPQQLSL